MWKSEDKLEESLPFLPPWGPGIELRLGDKCLGPLSDLSDLRPQTLDFLASASLVLGLQPD